MTLALRKLPQSSGQSRILFFHHAGGGGAQYFPGLKSFSADYEIYFLDLPGRFFRSEENPFSSMQDLTKALSAQLATLPPKPTYLMGHSFGSIVAYALAWDLVQATPELVKGLAVSAIKPPSELTRESCAKIAALSEQDLLTKIEMFAPLPEMVKKDPSMIKVTLKAVRDDFALLASFKNTHAYEVLPVPSFIFGGEQDTQVPAAELEKWSALIQTRNKPTLFPGHHFYIFSQFEKALSILLGLEN